MGANGGMREDEFVDYLLEANFFSTEPHTNLFNFVHCAIKTLKERCPGLITEGLLRVDVFQNSLGNLVVNEFESLDAAYYSSDMSGPFHVALYLQLYWQRIICNSIEEAQYISARS